MRVARRQGPATTMNAIADEAGVTKPIIYRTLGSKAEVARAISAHLGEEVETMTTAILAERGSDGGSFRATARAFFELMADERQLFLFITYGWPSNDEDQLEAMIERSAERFIDRFERLESPPHSSPTASRTWGLAMVAALRTIAVFWVKEPYCDIDELVDQVDVLFHHAFGLPEPT